MIKRGRAKLSMQEINQFFDKFEETMEGVTPENLWNYDETNMQDNPGAVKAIFARGVKYAEQVRDHTKSSISVMFCGSATGDMLPPYVVYKAANVYARWCKGCFKGTLYNSSTSGWFDMFIFEDWFFKSFLPRVRDLPGKKLLIGDNLSSHLSVEVINTCRRENIAFVCLPPNSTDKMQPLDVGFFAPLKGAWRRQLRVYSDQDPSCKLLDKPFFPKMLKEVITAVNGEENPLHSPHLPNAFQKCGLWPINRQKVLDRIPSAVASQDVARHLDAALLQRLEVRRFGDGSGKKQPRGKKVPAGQSYSAEESEMEESEEEEEESEMEESEAEQSEVEEEEVVNVVRDQQEESEDEEELPDIPPSRKSGSFVVALYEGQWFLAEVSKEQGDVAEGYTRLNYLLIKGTNSFSWGDKPDICLTLNEDIILDAVVPEPLNSRGHLGLNKADLKFVTSWMVGVYLPSQHYIILGKNGFFNVILKGFNEKFAQNLADSCFFPVKIHFFVTVINDKFL